MSAALRRVLDQPIMGFVPWIVLSVVEGPGRVVLASALALAAAVLILLAGLFAAVRPKLLDVTAIVFFGALVLVAMLSGEAVQRWLGVWSGEVSNATIALLAVASLIVRRPFTLAYARETTEEETWDTPLFLRINYAISGVWASAFLVTAVVGYIGDGPLHQPDNVWTNWIVQIGLMILAGKFTAWYPDYAVAAAESRSDPSGRPDPAVSRSLADLIRPLVAYLIPAGIVVMIVTDREWWIGAVLVVAGIAISRRLRDVADEGDDMSVTEGSA